MHSPSGPPALAGPGNPHKKGQVLRSTGPHRPATTDQRHNCQLCRGSLDRNKEYPNYCIDPKEDGNKTKADDGKARNLGRYARP